MINLLSVAEQRNISVQKLEQLEQDIFVTFGMEFNYPGPLESLERFLRLTNLHQDK